uniref:Uncharacterized protein n=1 Tax=Ixodes scapularis TaxID=6945 RepID=A0A4D5RX89_IXOSC
MPSFFFFLPASQIYALPPTRSGHLEKKWFVLTARRRDHNPNPSSRNEPAVSTDRAPRRSLHCVLRAKFLPNRPVFLYLYMQVSISFFFFYFLTFRRGR